MKDQVKISVIATGFDAPVAMSSRREVAFPASSAASSRSANRSRSVPEPVAPDDHGFGVNMANLRDPREDVFDIPTFLRRQMD